MQNNQQSRPQIVTLERPKHHYALLSATDGRMLGLDHNGDLALFDEADDRVIWDRAAEDLKHVATRKKVAADIGDDVCTLSVSSERKDFHFRQGPEKTALRVSGAPAAGRLGVSQLHPSAGDRRTTGARRLHRSLRASRTKQ